MQNTAAPTRDELAAIGFDGDHLELAAAVRELPEEQQHELHRIAGRDPAASLRLAVEYVNAAGLADTAGAGDLEEEPPAVIELRVPVSAELLERAQRAAAAPMPKNEEEAHANRTELELLEYEIGRQALEAGVAAGAAAFGGGDLAEAPREPLSAGALERTILLELEAELALGRSKDGPMIAELARAAASMAELRSRQDAETIGPVLPPDRLKWMAGTIARAGEALRRAQTVTGRFVPEGEDPELTNRPWATARILPDGFEDLDPLELVRIAGELLDASKGDQ